MPPPFIFDSFSAVDEGWSAIEMVRGEAASRHLSLCNTRQVLGFYSAVTGCFFLLHCSKSVMPEPSPRHDDESDPRLELTMVAVGWNVVASIASRLLGVSDCCWG